MAQDAELNIKITSDLEQEIDRAQGRIEQAQNKPSGGISQKSQGMSQESGAMLGALIGGGSAGAIGGAVGSSLGPLGAIIGSEVGKQLDEKFIGPLKDVLEARFMDLIGVTEDNGKAAKAFYAKSPKWFADIVVGLEGVKEAIEKSIEQQFSDKTVDAWSRANKQAGMEIKRQNYQNEDEWMRDFSYRRDVYFQRNQAEVSADIDVSKMANMKEIEQIEIMYSKESQAAEKRKALGEFFSRNARETGTSGNLSIQDILPGGD